MAIPFKEPEPSYGVRVTTEKSNITKFFNKRGVPKSEDGKLLLASWNIANFGAQKRKPEALSLIAHILQRFDLIAVQEVNENYRVMKSVVDKLRGYDFIMTDTAGNSERLVYIYRKSKVKIRQLFGEVALREREYPKEDVEVRYREDGAYKTRIYQDFRYVPFDRNPFIASFHSGALDFTLVNVHLYFGKWQDSKKEEDQLKYCRRVMEIFALAKWADRRNSKETTYDKDILLMGDMNIPVMDENNSAYKALVNFGMRPVDHVNNVGGTNINDDKTYDQIAIAPDTIQNKVLGSGTFDFDNAIFKNLWADLSKDTDISNPVSRFSQYVKHHISDHRPIWVQLDVS